MNIATTPEMMQNGQINPLFKHFFFSTFQLQKDMRKLKKLYGKFQTVGIALSDEESFIMAILSKEVKGQKVDTEETVPLTPEKRDNLLKSLQVKDAQRAETKSIFIKLDFIKKSITIKQVKKDDSIFKVVL